MQLIPARSIVSKTKHPDAWFGTDYNMNIYRGCSHGCIYCDSRSECYGSPDFDTVKVKEDALRIIREELQRKSTRGVIATGAMSDPYNPLEQTLCLTRGALELIARFGFGVAIDTKGTLVARDVDALQEIKKQAAVLVKMTITTADAALCSNIEPHAASPEERFAAVRTLSDGGIFAGVLMTPILPFINDTEENIRDIITRAADAGAKFVYPAMGVTLRAGNREYFYEKLDAHFPGVKQKYMQAYGTQYMCTSPNAKRLWEIVAHQCGRLGLRYEMQEIIAAYKAEQGRRQTSLF